MNAMRPEALAKTHEAAFGGRGWSAAEFERYLEQGMTLVLGDVMCFGVFRLAGPEAEVLTLATHPRVQNQGRATKMLRDALPRLQAVKVEGVFLEVEDSNLAARAVYERCGFVQFSTRPAYYSSGADAICMKATLEPQP